jgi:integrase
VPAAQVREALAIRLPRAERGERRAPKALTGAQYDRLSREAKARIADDPLAGARDLAIVLVLCDAGLRCEELAHLHRRDFLPARKGARPRALEVRRSRVGPDPARLGPGAQRCRPLRRKQHGRVGARGDAGVDRDHAGVNMAPGPGSFPRGPNLGPKLSEPSAPTSAETPLASGIRTEAN